MSCRGSLEYTCPSHGGWGMVRIGMMIPECHQLFVCPSACGRHGALGAVQQGFKDRLSYLYVEQSDIISGYDNAMIEAVGEVLNRLKKRPKVILVFVSCIDDLIGTDGDAVIAELEERYPDIKFRMGHMNPISTDSDEPPLVTTWKSVYSLMEWNGEQRIPAINMLGNYVPVHKESEIYTLMKLLGMEVHHIGDYTTYEELRDMGNHYINLLVSPKVEKVGQLLEKTEKIQYQNGHITCDFEEIRENYKVLLQRLATIAEGDENREVLAQIKEKETEIKAILKKAEDEAKKAIAKAKETVGNRPIYIDYSAFGKPLEAGKFLCEQGFSVKKVYVKDLDEENEAYQWLLKETEAEIIKANHHVTVNTWRSKRGLEKDDTNNVCEKCNADNSSVDEPDKGIAIGMEAAYISGSTHIVPMFQTEGMYGVYGVTLLMERLCEAAEKEADIEEIIRQAGLVA